MIYRFWSAALLLITSGFMSVSAADVSERQFSLGVLNGQVQEGNTVRVSRTLPESVIYRLDPAEGRPGILIIRDAAAGAAPDGAAAVTVRHLLPGGQQNAYVTLNVSLFLDSKKVPLSFSTRGEDLILSLPAGISVAELRVDAPAELQVPAGYRGQVQVTMQIEHEYSDE